MLEQKEFNRFVTDYNADYLYLLRRAATGNYNCLITSSRILKDFHDMIMLIHSSLDVNFDILPIHLRCGTYNVLTTGIYRRQNGKWKLAAVHITNLPENKLPIQ
jgi:hypothetical protein